MSVYIGKHGMIKLFRSMLSICVTVTVFYLLGKIEKTAKCQINGQNWFSVIIVQPLQFSMRTRYNCTGALILQTREIWSHQSNCLLLLLS